MNYDTIVGWDVNLVDIWYTDIDNPLVKGLVRSGVYIVTGAPAVNAGYYMPGAMIQNAVDKTWYINTGSTASPVWSLIESSNLAASTFAYNSDATAGALTIPAAKMVNALLDRNGGTTNRIDTTDTAAAIIALLPGVIVGSTFEFVYRNNSATPGQQNDLVGGSGVTISGTASIFAGGDITYIAIVTNVGTPALTLYAEADTSALLPTTDVANSVNTLQLTPAATTVAPIMAPVGSDTNIGHIVDAKGTGQVEVAKNSTGGSTVNRGSLKALIIGQTLTALGTTQNSTPTIAQLLGGVVTQTGVTGAGTVTLPLGTAITAGITGAQVGDTFQTLFANLGGGFNLTITGATGSTVIGTAAVPSGKTAMLTFVCTGTNTWNVYVNLSA